MTIFLGVDGGGSKTAYVLVDDQGAVLASAEGASCYYFGAGLGLVRQVLTEGVSDILQQARVDADDIDHAFFGLPGYGEATGDTAELDRIPAEILGHGRYECDNDMVCAWSGSLGGRDGINVISGTGSMTYGRRGALGCRVGGWGELIGDEGSAHWIGLQALNAFSRMSDGRLPTGPLQSIVRNELQLENDLDVVSLLIDGTAGGRARIAALARSVSDAAEAGDEASQGILAQAGDELAQLVATTRTRLGFDDDETVPVSFSGGVFSSARVLAAFAAALNALSVRIDLRPPLLSPVLGAAVFAARQAGHGLSDSTLTHLAHTSAPVSDRVPKQ